LGSAPAARLGLFLFVDRAADNAKKNIQQRSKTKSKKELRLWPTTKNEKRIKKAGGQRPEAKFFFVF
jgi:hypothetical protein